MKERVMRILSRFVQWYDPDTADEKVARASEQLETATEQSKTAKILDKRTAAAIKSYREAEAAYRR